MKECAERDDSLRPLPASLHGLLVALLGGEVGRQACQGCNRVEGGLRLNMCETPLVASAGGSILDSP